MKILLVNCANDASYSTTKLMMSLEKNLSQVGCEFLCCFESGKSNGIKNAYCVSGKYEYLFYYVWSRMIGSPYGTGYLSTRRLINKIKKYKPDVVHVHCPNANAVNIYQLLGYLKKKKINTVVTNHAEFFYTGSCAHAYECEKYMTKCDDCQYENQAYAKQYRKNKEKALWEKMNKAFAEYEMAIMVAVSPWQEHRIRKSTIAAHLNCLTILNGIDVDKFHIFDSANKNEESYILHVTSRFTLKEDDVKGGRYIARLAENMKDMPIKIYIAGTLGITEDEEKLLPKNIQLLGKISDELVLAEYYSNARLTVITSKRETFGMSCAESLCCGTPVVGFKNGGSESIALDEYTKFVPYGAEVELLETVKKWISYKNEENSKEIEKAAQERYSDESMAKKYYEIYCQMCEGKE